jgi:hypothetical protein
MRLASNPIRPIRKGRNMIVIKIDVLDGRGAIDVVVSAADADRLRKFVNDADPAFADQERWVKVRGLMSHERSGPNVGWTLSMVMPGEDPDEAIDGYRVDPLKWSKAAGVEEF